MTDERKLKIFERALEIYLNNLQVNYGLCGALQYAINEIPDLIILTDESNNKYEYKLMELVTEKFLDENFGYLYFKYIDKKENFNLADLPAGYWLPINDTSIRISILESEIKELKQTLNKN